MNLKNEANCLRAAFGLLTRIPVGAAGNRAWPSITFTAAYFPLVGLGVGGIAWGVAMATKGALPPLAASLTCVLAMAIVTGALHEDGLADAADGFLGARDRDQRLAIMKEGSIGAYGSLALWFLLTARLIGIREGIARGPWFLLGLLMVTQTFSRSVWLILLSRLSYLRREGAKFLISEPISWQRVGSGLIVPFALAFLLLEPVMAVSCLLLAGATAFFLTRFFRKELGGVTGDCLGAASQAVEVVCYLPFIVQGGFFEQ